MFRFNVFISHDCTFFSRLCCCFRLWSHNGLMPCQLNNKKLQSFSHVCMSVKFSNYTNFHVLRISSHDYLGMVLACHYQQPTLLYEYAWYFVWGFETRHVPFSFIPFLSFSLRNVPHFNGKNADPLLKLHTHNQK